MFVHPLFKLLSTEIKNCWRERITDEDMNKWIEQQRLDLENKINFTKQLVKLHNEIVVDFPSGDLGRVLNDHTCVSWEAAHEAGNPTEPNSPFQESFLCYIRYNGKSLFVQKTVIFSIEPRIEYKIEAYELAYGPFYGWHIQFNQTFGHLPNFQGKQQLARGRENDTEISGIVVRNQMTHTILKFLQMEGDEFDHHLRHVGPESYRLGLILCLYTISE